MSEQQIKETKKSNNQRRRKNYRNRRKNPVKTQQKIQEVKKSDEYKSVQEIAEKLASVFADLAEDVENCKKSFRWERQKVFQNLQNTSEICLVFCLHFLPSMSISHSQSFYKKMSQQ